MKRALGRVARRLPVVGRIMAWRDAARFAGTGPAYVPAGHFYSPIADLGEVRAREGVIFADPPRELPAIDLNEARQLELFESLAGFYQELPFPEHKTADRRYYFENDSYSYSDAICLYGMIRHARPKRLVEVGSGFSSCVTLDTNELFFDNAIDCTFVEPHPDLLLQLLREEDKPRVRLIPRKLQDVPLDTFAQLRENDILFIDSTHVSKVGSDVNHALFHVLPALRPGVLVHFHDVFYPFEYPKAWVYEGRGWNEAYLLRAFLMDNRAFRVEFFNTFLSHFHPDRFRERMPLCLRNPGGSIWLRKVAAA